MPERARVRDILTIIALKYSFTLINKIKVVSLRG